MLQLDFHSTGRHWLQIPGPSRVPDHILRETNLPTVEHRGREQVERGLKLVGIKLAGRG